MKEVSYIPSDLINNLSCSALGLVCYLIANQEKMFICFEEISRANRGNKKELPEIMKELIAKNIAEEIQDNYWRLTFSQPGHSIQMIVTEKMQEL